MLSMKTCFGSVALKWTNCDTCKRASEKHALDGYVADVLHLTCRMLLVNGKSGASFEY